MSNFTIVVNRREIPATFRMYACHMTTRIKGIQTKDFYGEFLRDTILTAKELVSYVDTYHSYKEEWRPKKLNWTRYVGLTTALRENLLLAAWYGEFFYDKGKGKDPYTEIYLEELINTGINYSRFKFSDKYNSLYPLTKFYKKLTIDYDEERYYPLYEKDYVTMQDIEKALEGTGVTYEDIKDDIDLHSVLCPYKDYYIWGSKKILNWLREVDHSILFTININKVLSEEHNLF